jgi:predicted CXXCH cytochrome family protein
MHLAGIRCEGCHFLKQPKGHGAGAVHTAGDASCMACHGPRYGQTLRRWRHLLDARLATSQAQLATARRQLPASAPAVADAEANLELVSVGHGVHNIDYALDVLWANHRMLNAALGAAGARLLPAPWKQVSYPSDCLRCHQGIELQSGMWQGRRFDHGRHVADQGLDCLTCHRPHAERARSEVVSLAPADCLPCHHSQETGFAQRCAACHASVLERIVAVDADWGDAFDHAYHVREENLGCTACHAAEVTPAVNRKMCADCHE